MKPSYERYARTAWIVLANLANARHPPITHKELCRPMGLHHLTAAGFLGIIQDHCSSNGLPALQALVINLKTGLPGNWYLLPRTRQDHDLEIRKVHSKQWSLTPPRLW
jgi:hypothetical protein